MSPSAVRKMEKTSDVERLKEIFFEITECKDDSQQRGWAVHDDQQAIMEILEELLQILVRKRHMEEGGRGGWEGGRRRNGERGRGEWG